VIGRALTTACFVAAATATGALAFEHGARALTDPSGRTLAVGAYWWVKLAVVWAFVVFVMVRPPARKRSRSVVALTACAAALAAAVVLRAPVGENSTSLVVAGDVLATVSAAWMLVSVLALGRCFGILPEVRGLVTRGPYRLVRHPLYLGELGVCAGLVLAAPSAWNVTVAAVFVVAQVVRMQLEERALAEEFSDYAAYARRTPRLVPWRSPGRLLTAERGAA
jgi:protein-S-isoprenylcysteine O-methyltransferase Ste14